MAIRGWVYVLTNRAMPGLVKIGYSTKDPALRARELEGTGQPHPFVLVFDVVVFDPRDVEQEVHRLLAGCHEAKEFFRTSPAYAIDTIRSAIMTLGKAPLLESFEQSNAEIVAEAPLFESNFSTAICPIGRTEDELNERKVLQAECDAENAEMRRQAAKDKELKEFVRKHQGWHAKVHTLKANGWTFFMAEGQLWMQKEGHDVKTMVDSTWILNMHMQ
jgi:hypothetical protein